MSWTVAIGVDTHKDEHVAVAYDRVGRQLGSCSYPATGAGYLALLHWAQALGEPAFAIEGTGSYGAGLARFLISTGTPVFESERPHRRDRRQGKNDPIDAAIAARRLLTGEGLSRVRGAGVREDLRLLLLERRGVVRAETATLNQVRAVVVSAPAPIRERLDNLTATRLLAACARLRPGADDERVLVGVLRRLSRRACALQAELQELDRELGELVEALVPELLAEFGVGPVCAAQLVVSSGDPARMRSESSFAALAGTSPVDASSGRQQRHRLNRGGDRQLNRALHVIALNRVRHHEQTRRYYTRLIDSGKTTREARRCVKRALARHFYRRLCELPRLQEAAYAT
jgi:transposase